MKETEEILYKRCTKGTTAVLIIPKTFQDELKFLSNKELKNFIKRETKLRGG